MTKGVLLTLLYCLCLTCSADLFAQNDILSKTLNAQVSVAGQMTTDKFQQLIKDGFKSVIVNRPDDEAGNLVTAHQLRNIAEQSHISLIYQPVISGRVQQQDVVEFAKYYNSLPKPILMICKSGSRSTALFNQSKNAGLLHE